MQFVCLQGGMKAVVWTDLFQGVTVIISIVTLLTIVSRKKFNKTCSLLLNILFG